MIALLRKLTVSDVLQLVATVVLVAIAFQLSAIRTELSNIEYIDATLGAIRNELIDWRRMSGQQFK